MLKLQQIQKPQVEALILKVPSKEGTDSALLCSLRQGLARTADLMVNFGEFAILEQPDRLAPNLHSNNPVLLATKPET